MWKNCTDSPPENHSDLASQILIFFEFYFACLSVSFHSGETCIFF